MIDDVLLWGYQALAAAGVFVVVFALLRLRRENQALREKLDAYERRGASRSDAAGPRAAKADGVSVPQPPEADEAAS